jgi:phosphatidylglycerol lysyltransferase
MGDIICRHPAAAGRLSRVDDPMVSTRIHDMPDTPKRLAPLATALLGATLAGAMVAAVVLRMGRSARWPAQATLPLDGGGDGEADDPSASRAQAEETLRTEGHGALLPYQLGRDKHRFVSPGGGVIVSGRHGRFEVALGDPVGTEDAEPTIAAFVQSCRARRRIPAFYQATTESLPALHAAGMRTFRVGHEAIVDVTGFTLQTPRRANLRHTITRARRGGVTFEFHQGLDAETRARLVPGLVRIDAEWQRSAGPGLGFTIGRFDPREIDTTAIAVAVEADGQPSAFATFRSTGHGGWVLDLLRRQAGGTPGCVEGCLVEGLTALGADGATELSLGLAPLAGLAGEARNADERALVLAARLVHRWYDVDGLAFFKGKFDPTWMPRYMAVPDRRHVPGLAIALLGLHLGGYRSAGWRTVRGAGAAARPARPATPTPTAAESIT